MMAATNLREGFTRPIFIVGCERSGTTLLRAMLNAHPHLAIPYEAARFSVLASAAAPWTAVWTRSTVRAAIATFLSHPKVAFWGLDGEEIFGEVTRLGDVRYPDLLAAVYGSYARRQGKVRWGDKTPGNTFELPNLARAFPRAQFVHIVRDGRDVCLSWAHVDWAQYDVTTAARRWRQWVWSAYRPGERLGPRRYYAVRYEDLIRAPRATLEGVVRFLGEPFAEQMLSYHAGAGLIPEHRRPFHRLLFTPPDPSRLFVWKREMSLTSVVQFERIAGPTLARYGYEITPVMRRQVARSVVAQRIRQRVRDAVGAWRGARR